jgi:predicted acyl esterase
MCSSTPDGAMYACLEDVAQDGTVTLITEGQLPLIHRNISSTVQAQPRTPRTFAQADPVPMVPGEISSITFDLR